MATAELAQLLQASFSPDASARRAAERGIDGLQDASGFGSNALSLAQDGAQPRTIRQAAALVFKNWVKLSWDAEEGAHAISQPDRFAIKANILPVMIALAAEPSLQVQLSEAIGLMAKHDFPEQWGELVDQMISSLTPDNFIVNNAVLQTAHAIFKRWRSETRTDRLFLEIKFVLERFCAPFFSMFQMVDTMLSTPAQPPPPTATPALLSSALLNLLELFHDLTAQDLPEFFEDNMASLMGLLHKYLERPPGIETVAGAEDEDEETEVERIRAAICEIVQLFSYKYSEEFTQTDAFVQTAWNMVSSLGQSKRFDGLVNKAIGFLSIVVRMPGKQDIFAAPGTLEAFAEHIVLPNMHLRGFEAEMFEDDPSEYIRRDIEGSADSDTRRQAASEFTRALLERFEQQVTGIFTRYVNAFMQQYATDRAAQWQAKDTALFLLTSVASRGVSTAQQGVTATNALVDVVAIFREHVLPDLQLAPSEVNPIVRADAIRFLYAFRSQLTKDQLVQVLPLLGPHLGDSSVVIHTYAAMAIERILYMRVDGRLLFAPADVKPFAESILTASLRVIEAGSTPEQISANDHMMRCVMRVIVTARQTLAPSASTILQHLVRIIGEVSKNPSNPKFNHYAFEAVSGLVRFVVAANPSSLAEFEAALFPPFQYILQQDVAEFSPFVFQILSQLLELHPGAMPDAYGALVPPLLMATLWTHRGNVPALVRLVRAFLAKGAIDPPKVGQLRDILRFLMPIKAQDQYSMELLEAMYEHLDAAALQPVLRDIDILLLQRLTGGKTAKFAEGFVRTLCFLLALDKPGLRADDLVGAFDGIQPGIFLPVLQNILPDLQKTPARDRKIVAVGLSRLLTQSDRVLSPPLVQQWPVAMQALVKLFVLPQDLTTSNGASSAAADGADADDIVTADLEATGYQAAYSKLGAAEPDGRARIAAIEARIGDARELLARNLGALCAAKPGVIPPLLAGVEEQYAEPFRAYLASQHVTIR